MASGAAAGHPDHGSGEAGAGEPARHQRAGAAGGLGAAAAAGAGAEAGVGAVRGHCARPCRCVYGRGFHCAVKSCVRLLLSCK